MSSPGKRTETEIKLYVDDLGKTRRRLREEGFRVTRRRFFESNVIFDRDGSSLRKAGGLLRLRETEHACVVTYKGKSTLSKHKSREELETTVGDAAEFRLILERLGYEAIFQYEKFRTELAFEKQHGMATLDETPVGNFMELEGSPNWIDRTARKLGYSPDDYITSSYGALYVQYCDEHGLTPSNMVFPKKEKARRATS